MSAKKLVKKPNAKAHIKEIGMARFIAAFDHAMVVLKGDPRLVGLEKVRREIAREAALRGTGFAYRPFTLSKFCGPPDGRMTPIVDEMLPLAIAAARKADLARVGPVEPHDYVPSAMHMGDCMICGHLQNAPIHRQLT